MFFCGNFFGGRGRGGAAGAGGGAGGARDFSALFNVRSRGAGGAARASAKILRGFVGGWRAGGARGGTRGSGGGGPRGAEGVARGIPRRLRSAHGYFVVTSGVRWRSVMAMCPGRGQGTMGLALTSETMRPRAGAARKSGRTSAAGDHPGGEMAAERRDRRRSQLVRPARFCWGGVGFLLGPGAPRPRGRAQKGGEKKKRRRKKERAQPQKEKRRRDKTIPTPM